MKDIKILLVDDDEDVIEEISGKLKNIGYSQIKEVTKVEEIMSLVQSYSPNLILMDTQIDTNILSPEGYEICKQIRQKDFGKNIAIIGMSSNFGYRESWIEGGADKFLEKNNVYNKDILQKTIEEVLEKYKQR